MTQATAQIRWTIHDLEVLPQSEGTRYEIIDGERLVRDRPIVVTSRRLARSLQL